MAKSQDQIPGRSDTRRAEAFSDGVLAIIITLLVLELKPPQGEPGRLLAGLLAQWPTYLAYVTSYLYVAVIWLNHKATFKRIHTIDRGLHWANVGVLFTTALLPFATNRRHCRRGAGGQPERCADSGGIVCACRRALVRELALALPPSSHEP